MVSESTTIDRPVIDCGASCCPSCCAYLTRFDGRSESGESPIGAASRAQQPLVASEELSDVPRALSKAACAVNGGVREQREHLCRRVPDPRSGRCIDTEGEKGFGCDRPRTRIPRADAGEFNGKNGLTCGALLRGYEDTNRLVRFEANSLPESGLRGTTLVAGVRGDNKRQGRRKRDNKRPTTEGCLSRVRKSIRLWCELEGEYLH